MDGQQPDLLQSLCACDRSHMPKCPKVASRQQQFHMVLTSTGLSIDTMALNILSCTPCFLALQNHNGV